MNKSFLKFITDFGPLLVFFVVYYKSGNNLIAAIPPLIVTTIFAVAITYFMEKKIPFVPLLGCFLISLFGGLTIYFDNPIFIYIKPTIINIIFAIALLIAKIFFDRNLIKIFFKKSINLEEIGWNKLMYRWVGFFILLAALNEIVWRTQSEEFWVNFKVWAIISLTFLFVLFQLPLMNKYKRKNE